MSSPQEANKETFNELLDIESSLDAIDAECREELERIIAKYDVKKLPILRKRDSIVTTSMPSFWCIAFRNHPVLGPLLAEEDVTVFGYLSSISVEFMEDGAKKIIFAFNSNPYFSNDELIKEVTASGQTNSCEIKWMPGMNLVEPSKGGQKRRHSSSFFAWFSDADREVADIIATELYPNALKYYSGEYSPENLGEDDDSEDDLEDDDDDDDDVTEDEEVDEEDEE